MIEFQWGSKEDIYRVFRKYGSIEKIELIPEKFPKNSDGDECYAYITFSDSMSAFHAIRETRYIRDSLKIMLADTWRQPDRERYLREFIDDSEISLYVLNEYCLLEIFAKLDLQSLLNLSHVCERFNRIIRNRLLPQYKEIDWDMRDEQALSSFREQTQSIKDYVRKVSFKFDCIDRPRNFLRILDIFTSNLGENINYLVLENVNIDQRLHDQLKPIFQRLSVLKLHNKYADNDVELDLVHWCTKLRKLTISNYIEFNINAEHWQCLESASIDSPLFSSSSSYPNFFRNNRQLKRLKICIEDKFSMLSDICYHLPNLERLSIYCYSDTAAYSFNILSNLKNLVSLRLCELSVDNNTPNNMFSLLGQINTLKRLELIFTETHSGSTFVPTNCQIQLMAKKLINLEKFLIHGYTMSEQSVIAFLTNAAQVNELTLQSCDFTVSELVLKKIVQLRKAQAAKWQKPVESLVLYVDIDPLLLKDKFDGVISVRLLKDSERILYF